VLYHDLARVNPVALLGVIAMFLGVKLITSKRDVYHPIESEEAAEEWQQYEEWNQQNEDLWNPPSWSKVKPDASSPLLVGHSSVQIPNSVTDTTPSQLRPPRQSVPRPHSIPNRTPLRTSFDGRDDDSTLRRLSAVLDTMGTHRVRRLELDYLSDLAHSQMGRSPTRSEH
jgi:hypothetical protein